MKVTIKGHFETKTFETQADDLQSALIEIFTKTEEEDETGFFFPMEDADAAFWKTVPGFCEIEVNGVQYGAELA